MKQYRLGFSGAVLKRGFWLYVWRIRTGRQQFLYVGRTGDSSSRFAASPFSRLSQHLDIRPKATANMLLRHVRKQKFEPTRCSFEMVAFGPLFPEQPDLKHHRRVRDIIAPLEAALAEYLRERGYFVVGDHPVTGKPDRTLLARMRRAIDKVF
jgi:hypothetical protein